MVFVVNVLSVRMLELIFVAYFCSFFLDYAFFGGMRESYSFRWGGGEIIWGGERRRGRCSTR